MAGITHRHAPRASSIITAPSPPGGIHHVAKRYSLPPPSAPAPRRHAPPHHLFNYNANAKFTLLVLPN